MPADDTQDQQAQQEQREADQQDQQNDSHDESESLGDAGKAALKAEREARKKAESEVKSLAKRIEDFERRERERDEQAAKDQGKWEEIAKAREDELAQLKREIAERDLRDRKTAIAKAHDLPDEFVERLKGETDEELEADAKAIAKLLKIREVPDNDAGQRTPPGNKNRDKKQFADPARWGLRQ